MAARYWKVLKELASRIPVLVGTDISCVYLGGFVFNLTEPKRMARQIVSGNLRFLESETLDTNFCPVSLTELGEEVNVEEEDSFVGIVGTKSSGKSCVLKLFSWQNANVVCVTMTPGDEKVCEVLYQRLRRSVWSYHPSLIR